jgi:hypothetical protein
MRWAFTELKKDIKKEKKASRQSNFIEAIFYCLKLQVVVQFYS